MKLKKRRHFNNARGGRKLGGAITIYLQRIPREKFDALSETERYCLLLLGHVHDEISWLQRMAFAASRRDGRGTDLERSATMMPAMFLARLLLGKLFEFKKVLEVENSPIPSFIADYWRPSDKAAGSAQIEAILAMYKKEKWIRIARNKHFLHYPELGDVLTTLQDPGIHWDVEIAHGKKSSNTFYPASDVFANYAWLRRVNNKEPMKGLGEALAVLKVAADLTLQTLEQSIGYFVDQRLIKLADNDAIKIQAPSIYDLKLDYFVRTDPQ